jgi:glucokinase
LLSWCVDERYVAIDLGGTMTRIALSDRDLHLSGVIKQASDHSRGPAGIVDQIGKMLDAALAATDTPREVLKRGVVASPGPLDANTGVVHGAPNLPGWENEVPLRELVEDRLQIPVQPWNDADVAAVGEHQRGAGRGARNLVFLTVSTGIGGGVIIEGKLLLGSRGIAGEIGHTTIDLNGPLCKCGNIGCLEVLASGANIGRRYREALAVAAFQRGAVDESENRTAADLCRAAAEGDPLAGRVWSECMRALGFGVVNCIHIFNPERVVIGGGVTNAGEMLFGPVREIVAKHAMKLPREGVEIVRAELRDDAGLYGAASLAIDGTGAT